MDISRMSDKRRALIQTKINKNKRNINFYHSKKQIIQKKIIYLHTTYIGWLTQPLHSLAIRGRKKKWEICTS